MTARPMFVFFEGKIRDRDPVLIGGKGRSQKKTSERLTARFSTVKTITRTRQFHRFVPVDEGHLTVHELSRGPGEVVRIRR